jgi:hypothetical protein
VDRLTYWYMISGLQLRSPVRLAATPAGEPERLPDIVIEEGCIPDNLDDAADTGPNWQLGRNRLLIAVPAIGRFLLKGGRHIVFTASDHAREDALAAVISGSLLGLLLQQRGLTVLRASAVAVDGYAMLFCGPGGSGKSVLAAALDKAGYPLIADDRCVLTVDGAGVVRALPDGGGLQLWVTAIEQLDLRARPASHLRAGLEKLQVEPADSATVAMPVRALYALDARNRAEGISITPLVPARAAIQPLADAFNPMLARLLGQAAAYLKAGGILARSGGSFELAHRGRELLAPGALDRTIRPLEAHWRALRAEVGP